LEASRDLYEDLLKKLKEAGITAGLKSTNVDVVDPVLSLSYLLSRSSCLAYLLHLCSFDGWRGTSILAGTSRHHYQFPEQAETMACTPVLCVVPRVTSNGRHRRNQLAKPERNRPLSLVRPLSPFADRSEPAYRTAAQYCGKTSKVLVITSAVPGEGKTTMAINFAVALAQNGHRVLLVDADLRNGGLQNNCRWTTPMA